MCAALPPCAAAAHVPVARQRRRHDRGHGVNTRACMHNQRGRQTARVHARVHRAARCACAWPGVRGRLGVRARAHPHPYPTCVQERESLERESLGLVRRLVVCCGTRYRWCARGGVVELGVGHEQAPLRCNSKLTSEGRGNKRDEATNYRRAPTVVVRAWPLVTRWIEPSRQRARRALV